jgi:hypothetical protein
MNRYLFSKPSSIEIIIEITLHLSAEEFENNTSPSDLLDARSLPSVVLTRSIAASVDSSRAEFRPRTTIARASRVKGVGAEDREFRERPGGNAVLWTIFVILLVLWLLGVVSSYTLGGFIHLLLVLALVVLVLQLVTGRRPIV